MSTLAVALVVWAGWGAVAISVAYLVMWVYDWPAGPSELTPIVVLAPEPAPWLWNDGWEWETLGRTSEMECEAIWALPAREPRTVH